MTEIAALAAALDGRPLEITAALVERAEREGLGPLLAASRPAAQAAAAVRARLRRILLDAEALAIVRDRELRRVLDALAAAGLRPIVFKGAHLAHVAYASPGLRPRSDTDLLFMQCDCGRVADVLEGCGYTRSVHVRGSLILGQSHFHCVDPSGTGHALDVHWRVAAPLVFRHVLPADTVLASAQPIVALGPSAYGPSLPHALVLACVHLVAHHRVDPLLLWLYEIAALARALSDAEVETFVTAAATSRVRSVCREALQRAASFSDGTRLRQLMTRLESREDLDEPSARMLEVTYRIDELRLDLRVAEGWRERATLLKEHLWPDPEYMRATRPDAGWLAAAYARRAVDGARSWLRTKSASRRTAESDESPADPAAASSLPAASRTSR